MPILTKNTGSNNSSFSPAPEGDFQGVVVDLVDLGWLEKTFEGRSQGLKPHVQFVYQIGGMGDDGEPVEREDGTPYLVFGRRQVLSMHERAGFYKEACMIIGKKALDEALETGEFDTEDFVGKNVSIVIAHNEGSNGQTYANIEAMKPWNPRHGDLIEPTGYERRHLRENYEGVEFSAFEPMPPGATIEKAREAKPKFEKSPMPQRNGKVELDPRSVNPKHSPTEYAKAINKGEEPKRLPKATLIEAEEEEVDPNDPFADS